MATMTSTTPELFASAEAGDQDQLDLVVIGHVDHGKSTLIGRLLADTGSLPEGKLEQVRANCARTARPFEYAFLLDALKNEQSQGITIDTARCFFSTARRRYIINDAPGHIEFLKNMVTGAARAEAALLVIDAAEGVRENSRRHGYIASMLGIRQVVVLVNKMDLVDYDQVVFERIKAEYLEFLSGLGVRPLRFIPIAAREGVNITALSPLMPWYDELSVLEQVDAFEKEAYGLHHPFRMPVQDIYKFTESEDDRRIIAGTIETGSIRVGDEVVFLPSGKSSTIQSIEAFSAEPSKEAVVRQAAGFTLREQIYIKPGELMCRRADRPARVGTRFRANIFWMGRSPMVAGKRYKLKLGAARVPVELVRILSVLDASEMSVTIQGKQQVERHDVAECLLETTRPVAFDLAAEIEQTSRFVIVDHDQIAACGIVLDEARADSSLLAERVRQREAAWDRGLVSPAERQAAHHHAGKFIVVAGLEADRSRELARRLEQRLFGDGLRTYYLGLANVPGEFAGQHTGGAMGREQQLQRLGELARVMTDAGLLFITAIGDADDFDLEKLRLLNEPYVLFVVAVGETALAEFPVQVRLAPEAQPDQAIGQILAALTDQGIVPDYQI